MKRGPGKHPVTILFQRKEICPNLGEEKDWDTLQKKTEFEFPNEASTRIWTGELKLKSGDKLTILAKSYGLYNGKGCLVASGSSKNIQFNPDKNDLSNEFISVSQVGILERNKLALLPEKLIGSFIGNVHIKPLI